MATIDYARIRKVLRGQPAGIQGIVVPTKFWQKLVTETSWSTWSVVELNSGTFHNQWMGMYVRLNPYLDKHIIGLDRRGDIVLIINLEDFHEKDISTND